MKSRLEIPKSPIRRAIWAVNGLLILGLVIYWAIFAPPPVSGGTKPDSVMARWVKSRIYASIPPQEDRQHTRLTHENANGWYSLAGERIQSVGDYQSIRPTRPTSQRRVLVLQPIGPFTTEQKQLLTQLREYCEAYFQLPTRIAPPLALPTAPGTSRPNPRPKSTAFAGANQYDSAYIIDKMLTPQLPPDAVAYLGVTMADLWNGDLNYVFGLGSFRARTGVYSLARYYPEFWGQRSTTQTRPLTLRRSCLVLNHEAGHMFSLTHCVLYKCSLNGSNSLADADNSPLEPCPVCHRKLAWNLEWDEAKRTRELNAFYKKHSLDSMLKSAES